MCCNVLSNEYGVYARINMQSLSKGASTDIYIQVLALFSEMRNMLFCLPVVYFTLWSRY
jgi:hypothetical protein